MPQVYFRARQCSAAEKVRRNGLNPFHLYLREPAAESGESHGTQRRDDSPDLRLDRIDLPDASSRVSWGYFVLNGTEPILRMQPDKQ